jgi:hypothetical protein
MAVPEVFVGFVRTEAWIGDARTNFALPVDPGPRFQTGRQAAQPGEVPGA